MINLNGNKELLTLTAIIKDEASELVDQSCCATTLISEDKKIYTVIAPDKDLRKCIKGILAKFVSSNKQNVNIDVDSFLKLNKKYSKEQIFNAIYEAVSFAKHNKVSFKKTKKANEVVYNLVTKENFDQVLKTAQIKTEFVNYARDLQDTPPNIATSVYLAEKLAKDASEIRNLKVTVLTKKEAEKLGMGLLLAVNAGSSVEARVVVLEYIGDSSKPKTALVGKGITFDSGGYNLKPSNFMEGMKFDMSGAVIMCSTVMALAKAEAKTNVVAVGMFTDNRIGHTATLPESVIKSMNGLTVEIDNTDAEGRLVLADGITYAIREMKAEKVYEASTLTGAIAIALGRWATGVFTHYDEMWNEFSKASEFTGERMWRMPIFEEHLEKVQNDAALADLTNSAKGREAGSSTAAAFLNEFAENKEFMHLDIAATADIDGRGQGVLIKTLFELLAK